MTDDHPTLRIAAITDPRRVAVAVRCNSERTRLGFAGDVSLRDAETALLGLRARLRDCGWEHDAALEICVDHGVAPSTLEHASETLRALFLQPPHSNDRG